MPSKYSAAYPARVLTLFSVHPLVYGSDGNVAEEFPKLCISHVSGTNPTRKTSATFSGNGKHELLAVWCWGAG
jgi:hypothetical protein